MSPKVVLFLLATLVLISSSSVSDQMWQDEMTNRQVLNWLVQTWPIGYCYTIRCNRFSRSQFIIHGLWPQNSPNSPINRNVNLRRNRLEQMLQTYPVLKADMDTYWPTLTKPNNKVFWLDEWNNHGSYQNSLEPRAYFNNTIQVVKHRINLMRILQDGGIVPNNTRSYELQSYIAAIREQTQRQPLLLCNRYPYRRKAVLKEVVICMDTIANGFVSCPVPSRWRYGSLCPRGQIWFLESHP